MVLSAPLPEGLRPGGRFPDWLGTPSAYVLADVDGTLIGPLHHATDRVVEAAGQLAAAGVAAGFATGRGWDSLAGLRHQLGLQGPHILYNGGEVRADGEVVARWDLPAQVVDGLLAACRQRGLYAELYLEDRFVVTDRREHARAHWALLGEEPAALVGARGAAGLPPVIKATVVLSEDGDPAADAVLPELQQLGVSVTISWAPATPGLTYLNVTHPDADKGKALHVAAEHLGVGLAAVAAVGDGLNDVPLLQAAGTAIAMGQSPAALQAAAHLVVPEVAEDGVAHAFQALAGWAAAV